MTLDTNPKLDKKPSVGIFLYFTFLLLLSLFMFNVPEFAKPQWFDTFQNDSESLDVGRLTISKREGFLSRGGMLFDWLVSHARENRCEVLSLDSGVQRFAAHRFYLAKRMDITCHHFALKLG